MLGDSEFFFVVEWIHLNIGRVVMSDYAAMDENHNNNNVNNNLTQKNVSWMVNGKQFLLFYLDSKSAN